MRQVKRLKEKLDGAISGDDDLVIRTETVGGVGKYGRLLGWLYVGDGDTSLNEQMITEGYAWAYDGGTKKKDFEELREIRRQHGTLVDAILLTLGMEFTWPVKNSTDQYLGNPNLKKANTALDFTPEEVQEVIKCSEDPVYFIKTYIKIVSLDKGLIPFDMYHFQEEMVQKFHDNRFNIAKLPRQSGKSTIVTSYLLWYVLFNDNVNVAILANKAATAREMLQRLQLSYENLPK